MSYLIGLDIGGTKIAGGVISRDGEMLDELVVPTPRDYDNFLLSCHEVVLRLEAKAGAECSVGIGIAGVIDRDTGSIVAENLPFLRDKTFRDDIKAKLGREIRLTNDSNCMALSEATTGAGMGYASVFGLIVGTGVGGGFVCNKQVLDGVNGLAGEIGHMPLPFREPEDGVIVSCGCEQQGCVEKFISGGALSRLYEAMTGKRADAKEISALAQNDDADALRTLDRYYEVFAKAMVVVLHSFDPDVIVVGGGMNSLPALYEEVPKRWGKYSVSKNPKTKFVKAKHGSTSGVRGAAWLWG